MAETVEMHARQFFRDHAIHCHEVAGPVTQRLPGFRVMVIAPGPKTELWTYLTMGANRARHEGHANEFFILAPEANEAHIELVSMVAHYHASPRPGWLLPITRAKRDFKIAHGLEALEQRFDSGELEYWEPSRSSMV